MKVPRRYRTQATQPARRLRGAEPVAHGALVSNGLTRDVLALQRAAGNQAVGRLLKSDPAETTARPASKKSGPKKVVVVGSPGPGEISARHPLQFAIAAWNAGVDENTIWFVERTGYELGGVDLKRIEQLASPGTLVWITPSNPLVQAMNQLPANSIGSFLVFSHGLPGQVALRHGWDQKGKPDYGMSIPDVKTMRKDLFTSTATVRFDSCNTGTSDWYSPQGNLAQEFTAQSGRPTQAWTGRTTYSDINEHPGDPGARVMGSRVYGKSIDKTEVGSRLIGRTPELKTFVPVSGPVVGGFKSTLRMRVRLPKSRAFDVPEGGAVILRLDATEYELDVEKGEGQFLEEAGTGKQELYASLHRDRGFLRSDEDAGVRTFPIQKQGPHQEVWAGLTGGSYYLEFYRFGNTGIPVRNDVEVEVHGPAGSTP